MNAGDPSQGPYRVVLGFLYDTIRTIAFWLAIALPFAQLTLLASGIDSSGKTVVLLVLLCANVVMLLLGHKHIPTLANRHPGANPNQREADTPSDTVRQPGGREPQIRESDD